MEVFRDGIDHVYTLDLEDNETESLMMFHEGILFVLQRCSQEMIMISAFDENLLQPIGCRSYELENQDNEIINILPIARNTIGVEINEVYGYFTRTVSLITIPFHRSGMKVTFAVPMIDIIMNGDDNYISGDPPFLLADSCDSVNALYANKEDRGFTNRQFIKITAETQLPIDATIDFPLSIHDDELPCERPVIYNNVIYISYDDMYTNHEIHLYCAQTENLLRKTILSLPYSDDTAFDIYGVTSNYIIGKYNIDYEKDTADLVIADLSDGRIIAQQRNPFKSDKPCMAVSRDGNELMAVQDGDPSQVISRFLDVPKLALLAGRAVNRAEYFPEPCAESARKTSCIQNNRLLIVLLPMFVALIVLISFVNFSKMACLASDHA